MGRCWSEKLHLPFFSGQASNGIRHCYLDSHGTTHLGEPRGFSKTHGSEFPLFDRPKNQRGKTLEFMHQRFGSQTRWKKVTATPFFFFWPKSSTLDPSSFQAKALFVRFATAHGWKARGGTQVLWGINQCRQGYGVNQPLIYGKWLGGPL